MGRERGRGKKHRKTIKYHIFVTKFLTLGSPVPTLILDLGQIWHVSEGPWHTLPCQISSCSVYTAIYNHTKMTYAGLMHAKFQMLLFKNIFLSALAPSSVIETKLNVVRRTSLCPTIPRSFPYSNALMAKWRSQTLSFKSVTDKQTDKTSNLLYHLGARYPSPT